jgi:hypothetical protein
MAKVFYTLIVFSLNKFSSKHLTFIQTPSAFETLKIFWISKHFRASECELHQVKGTPQIKGTPAWDFWVLIFACIKAKRCLENVFRGISVFSISSSYQNFRHSTNTQYTFNFIPRVLRIRIFWINFFSSTTFKGTLGVRMTIWTQPGIKSIVAVACQK